MTDDLRTLYLVVAAGAALQLVVTIYLSDRIKQLQREIDQIAAELRRR